MNEDTKPEEWPEGPAISMGAPGDPPPPGTTFAPRFECEEAKESEESEEYHAIYADLDFVVDMARQLRAALLQNPQSSDDQSSTQAHDTVLRSLWIGALVTYARCFIQGKRRWIDESVFEGKTEDVLTYHRYFRATRDKHVAHSVNPFEIHATGVHVIDLDGEDPYVDSMVTVHLTRGNEQAEVVGYLEWLATYARDVVWKKHKEASDKALRKAELLSAEQLRRLRPLEIQPQQSFEAARTRRR
jgi:hypothetical protein